MRQQQRETLPPDLAEVLKSKKMTKGGGWPVYRKRPMNQHLLPFLNLQADNRCSYCGSWPMKDSMTRETIDHFRPKSKFPDQALAWENLLLACDDCQEAKGEKWNEHFLDPSAEEYRFNDWFQWDLFSAHLQPRHPEGTTSWERAQSMICACEINRSGVVDLRKRLRTKGAVARARGEPLGPRTKIRPGDWPF